MGLLRWKDVFCDYKIVYWPHEVCITYIYNYIECLNWVSLFVCCLTNMAQKLLPATCKNVETKPIKDRKRNIAYLEGRQSRTPPDKRTWRHNRGPKKVRTYEWKSPWFKWASSWTAHIRTCHMKMMDTVCSHLFLEVHRVKWRYIYMQDTSSTCI